jgi:glutamate dehydrogenase/leucine dehydrogenase
MGTSAKIMDWMTDEYNKISREHQYGIFTGKSVEFNGSVGREEATGRGVVLCIERWATLNDINLSEKTYIVQGFGNVGSNVCKFMNKLGAICIAIGDHTGYFKDTDGINISSLIEYAAKNKSIKDFNNYPLITKNEFFSIKCDIIVPAALEHEITKDIANLIDCKLVVEAANGPVTYEGDTILNVKNIEIIPDILCNAGGVTVSYFEWLQNRHHQYWDIDEINEKLQKKMFETFDKIYKNKPVKNMSLRESCYYYSLKNLENNYVKRGIIKL